MAKQAQNTGCHWYVIHTYSGYEDAVKKALEQRIESMNMQDYIFKVVVPKEKQIIMKNGQPKEVERTIFPGYVLINMVVNDFSWYVVRNTPNVTGFVGSGTIPVPVSAEEFMVVEKHMTKSQPKFKMNFQLGDQVTVLSGPFQGYEGLIDEIDNEKGRIKVLISMFGRETPMELEFTQVKKK